MDRDIDTAAIYQVGYSWEDKPVFVPVQATDEESRYLAFEWGGVLAKVSHRPVEIYRNGLRLITLPAQ